MLIIFGRKEDNMVEENRYMFGFILSFFKRIELVYVYNLFVQIKIINDIYFNKEMVGFFFCKIRLL